MRMAQSNADPVAQKKKKSYHRYPDGAEHVEDMNS